MDIGSLSGFGLRRRANLHPTLETPRLRLRPVVREDAAAFARHLADLEVTRWLARVPHPYRLSDGLAFVDHVRHAALIGSAVTLALLPAEAEEPVGVVALHGLDGTPEFGYWLARPYWGCGVMTEAVGAALDWIHRSLAVPTITSGAFVGNEASLRIQGRFGFKVVGRSRRECQALGRDLEHVDTRMDWQAYEKAART
ncbi:GNAT family N-acetyltransferase [Chthonobacter rhizosphaerae]|uniref:GNAT family N-acetyltransferase n=1 Tax=Chthonobacter rhizosphaerae TaxID=2735553 RepID=UPI0015EE5333|nr:GNAT family N-acetyltransferase [Chthonobacter rhizosphaerae]